MPREGIIRDVTQRYYREKALRADLKATPLAAVSMPD
jgi:hypothetical protein